MTGIYRTTKEDEALGGHGVHPAWRAIDIRAASWTDPLIEAAAKKINERWIYDPARPSMVVALFEPHGTGPHGHFQVYLNTKERA